jgi:outer membrane protein
MIVNGKQRFPGGRMKHYGLWAIPVGLMLLFVYAPLQAAEYTLEELYRIGMQQSEKVKISGENVEIADSGKYKALSALLPKATAFGAATQYTEGKTNASGSIIQPHSQGNWGLRIDETLSLSGRDFISYSLSKDGVEKSRFDYRAYQEDFLLTVSLAYFEFLKTRKGLEIADSNVERLTKYLSAARTRLKAGEITKTTVLRAEGELSGALSDQIKAKNAYEISRVSLARLVSIERDFAIREVPVQEGKTGSLAELQDAAVKRRPDVKSVEAQVKISEKQVDVTRGTYWPSVSLSGVYLGTDQDPATPTLNRDSAYGALTLNFPFFEGGLRRAEVRESEARYRQADLQYRDFVKSVNLEVENTYLELLAQKGILKSAQDQLVYAEDNIRAIAKQFEFGLASSLDVIDANNLLISAQKLVADATYNYQYFILRLMRVTGYPLINFVTGTEAAGSNN